MSEKKPTFAGELLFAGYTDSSRAGPRVTFRLADRDELERFIGKEGKRYMAVLVEIAEDETPAGAAPAPAQKASTPRERMAPLCELAVKLCRENRFHLWLAEGATLGKFPTATWAIGRNNEESAANAIKALCGVGSRKDLDTDMRAAQLFHSLIRRPYAAWLERQGVPA